MKNVSRIKVGLIGYGNLGQHLAKSLLKKGYQMVVTYRTNKIKQFGQTNCKGVYLDLSDGHEEISMQSLIRGFKGVESIVITLPFKRDFKDPWVYHRYIKTIKKALPQIGCRNIIFTSSTSIYSDAKGSIVSEGCAFQLSKNSERSTVLYECEKLLWEEDSLNTLIMRLGGILRPQIEKKILLKKTNYINLVYQEDIINIMIKYLVLEYKFKSIVNIVQNKHFLNNREESRKREDKIVSNKKLKSLIVHRFKNIN